MTGLSRLVDLAVAGNEASDLLPVRSPELLAAHHARRAFWTVLDEGPVERGLALLVQRDGGWSEELVAFDAGRESGRTEDGEALAHRDGWIYVIGSHFGSKRGPLRPRRAFVARFREAAGGGGGPVPLQVVRNQFRLHRAVNDALAAADIAVLPPGERVRERFIVETVARGTAREKTWVSRLAQDDLPMNVEAAAFTPAGTLLVGLRFPVTDKGEPIIVELAGVDGMFDDDPRSWPWVVRAYALSGVTPVGALTGFRALSARGDNSYDAVVGSIDAVGKGSVLLDEHPHGGEVPCRHVRFRLPAETGAPVLAGELVADLAPLQNVEGLAEVDGTRFYVTDEEHRVSLWSA